MTTQQQIDEAIEKFKETIDKVRANHGELRSPLVAGINGDNRILIVCPSLQHVPLAASSLVREIDADLLLLGFEGWVTTNVPKLLELQALRPLAGVSDMPAQYRTEKLSVIAEQQSDSQQFFRDVPDGEWEPTEVQYSQGPLANIWDQAHGKPPVEIDLSGAYEGN